MLNLREFIELLFENDNETETTAFWGISGMTEAQLTRLIGRLPGQNGVVSGLSSNAGPLGWWTPSIRLAISDATIDPVAELHSGARFDVLMRGSVSMPRELVTTSSSVTRAIRDKMIDVVVTDVVFSKNVGGVMRRHAFMRLIPHEWFV